MDEVERVGAAQPPNPPRDTRLSRPRRGRLTTLGSLGLAVVAVVVVFGSYDARRTFVGDQNICIVTNESLSHDGNSYNGGVHPRDPQVGDRYVGSSGCNASETQCTRRIELIGIRLVC